MSDDLLSFDYSQNEPLDIEETSIEAKGGVVVREIAFAVPGYDRRVDATLVRPAGDDVTGPLPGVLWVHWFEPRSQDSNRTQFMDEAITLAKEGVVSLLPDAFWTMVPARWQGAESYRWQTEFAHDRDLSIRQVVELRRALDVLIARPNVDADRIAFVGHDFGAMYGALLAAVDKRASAYVLMAGTYSFSDWFMYGKEQVLTNEEKQAYIEKMRILDPTRYVQHAAPARLLFQFAHNDYYVPERAAQVFYDAASEPKDIRWYDAQHDLKDMDNESGKERLDWLREQLAIAADNNPNADQLSD